MKKFFSQLISGKDDVSSKRVASLFVLLNVLVLAYLAAVKNDGQVPEFMFDALCLIVGGGLGLTSLEKIFSKKENKKPLPVEEPIIEEPETCPHCGK